MTLVLAWYHQKIAIFSQGISEATAVAEPSKGPSILDIVWKFAIFDPLFYIDVKKSQIQKSLSLLMSVCKYESKCQNTAFLMVDFQRIPFDAMTWQKKLLSLTLF